MIVECVLGIFDAIKHGLAKFGLKVRVHISGVYHQRRNLQERSPHIVRDAKHLVAGNDNDVGFHVCPQW